MREEMEGAMALGFQKGWVFVSKRGINRDREGDGKARPGLAILTIELGWMEVEREEKGWFDRQGEGDQSRSSVTEQDQWRDAGEEAALVASLGCCSEGEDHGGSWLRRNIGVGKVID